MIICDSFIYLCIGVCVEAEPHLEENCKTQELPHYCEHIGEYTQCGIIKADEFN